MEEVLIPPQCPNAIYETRMAEAVLRFRDNGVRHIGFGDIFLQNLRAYRERNLGRLELYAFFPLWDIDTRVLATRFVRDGFRACTACIDPSRLDKSFAGRELMPEFFADLPAGVDPCGENGEFHTFVLDGPIFRAPVPVRTGDVVERDSFFSVICCQTLMVKRRAPQDEFRSIIEHPSSLVGSLLHSLCCLRPNPSSSLEFHSPRRDGPMQWCQVQIQVGCVLPSLVHPSTQ